MNRVVDAVKKNRCVLALSQSLIAKEGVLEAVKSRTIPVVSLGDSSPEPTQAATQELLEAHADSNHMVVLVEPDFSNDKTLELAQLIGGLKQRPQIFVVAKAFNRFALPGAIRLAKIHHIKKRGDLFLSELPVEEEAPAVEEKAQPKAVAPQLALVGREKQVEALKELLAEPGRPVQITGPAGIGKRSLVEAVIPELELERLSDIHIHSNMGTDALLGRIAIAAASKGSGKLQKALNGRKDRPAPEKIVELAIEALQSESMAGTVLVVSGMESLLDNRDKSFYSEGMLEMLLHGLACSELQARLVLISVHGVQFHHPDQKPRTLEVPPLAKEHAQTFLTNWHVDEETAAAATDLFDRTFGHPMALRQVAIALRDGLGIEKVQESARGRLKSPSDQNGVRKGLRKAMDKLDKDAFGHLVNMSLFHAPVPAEALQQLGMNRKARLALIGKGLMEQSLRTGQRKYYIHPLVRGLIRKGASFDLMIEVALDLLDSAKGARRTKDMNTELSLIQDANLLLSEARKGADSWRTSVPYCDPLLSSIRKLIFYRKRLEPARKQLQAAFRQCPLHPELLKLEVSLMRREGASNSELAEKFERMHAKAPTPEGFHMEASIHMERNSVQRATATLQKAVTVFPRNARLHRRLGALLVRQGLLAEAVQVILKSSELQPLMPDGFSMLGDVMTRLGSEHWERAHSFFARAEELGTTSPVHMVRKANMLRARGLSILEEREASLKQAEELLRQALKAEKDNGMAQTTLATVLLDLEKDGEEIEELLKPSLKRRNHADAYIQCARLRIRQKRFDEVEKNLDRAYKLASNKHYAYYVRGEYYAATGDVFRALNAFQTALDRCPETAAEQAMYKQYIAQMRTIIESGTADEMIANSELHPKASKTGEGFRREPGSIRRRSNKPGEQESESAETADQTVADDAPETQEPGNGVQETETAEAQEAAEEENAAPAEAEEPQQAAEEVDAAPAEAEEPQQAAEEVDTVQEATGAEG